MDEHRFDTLVRALSERGSRRGALRLLPDWGQRLQRLRGAGGGPRLAGVGADFSSPRFHSGAVSIPFPRR